MKILIIVTSTETFANGKLATGLWLSEFTQSIIVQKKAAMT